MVPLALRALSHCAEHHCGLCVATPTTRPAAPDQVTTSHPDGNVSVLPVIPV